MDYYSMQYELDKERREHLMREAQVERLLKETREKPALTWDKLPQRSSKR